MKKSITWQLGIIIVSVIFISLMITSLSNYWVSYQKTYEAAGIEAVGCANITTGLIRPSELEQVIKGDTEQQESLNKKLNWTTEHKRIFEDQYILALDGTILAEDSNLEKQGFKPGDKFPIDKDIVKMIQEMKHPQYSAIYEFGGMKRITGYAPIFKDQDPNKEIIGLNAIDFNAKIVSERTWASVQGSLLLGLLPMAIACAITIWLIRRKTKPITMLIDYAKTIADGNLSVENVYVKNKDEIGDLAAALNYMAKNLRELIQQFRLSAEQVAASSKELTESTYQTNDATKKISATMLQLANGVDQQVSSLAEVSQTANEISNGIQQIANNSEMVSKTALEASDKASEGGLAIQTAVQQMNSMKTTVNGLEEVIKGLGDRSKEINQIIEVITRIAVQTNLLALNAAIEAARAGEHGRGFAVVADEVRKLAEQSALSAQEVSNLISMIQEETYHAVQTMEVAGKEVIAGIGAVNIAGESFQQIQESVNEVTFQIQEVSSSVQQISAGTEQMVAAMQFITEVAEVASTSTQDVSASTEEQWVSIEEVSSSVKSLSTMADELQKHIRKFTV